MVCKTFARETLAACGSQLVSLFSTVGETALGLGSGEGTYYHSEYQVSWPKQDGRAENIKRREPEPGLARPKAYFDTGLVRQWTNASALLFRLS